MCLVLRVAHFGVCLGIRILGICKLWAKQNEEALTENNGSVYIRTNTTTWSTSLMSIC